MSVYPCSGRRIETYVSLPTCGFIISVLTRCKIMFSIMHVLHNFVCWNEVHNYNQLLFGETCRPCQRTRRDVRTVQSCNDYRSIQALKFKPSGIKIRISKTVRILFRTEEYRQYIYVKNGLTKLSNSRLSTTNVL